MTQETKSVIADPTGGMTDVSSLCILETVEKTEVSQVIPDKQDEETMGMGWGGCVCVRGNDRTLI